MQPSLIGLPVDPSDSIEPGQSYWSVFLIVSPSGAKLVRADITSWALRIYARQSASEETPVYTLTGQVPTATNPDTSAIISTSVQTDGFKRHPEGYVFKHLVALPSLFTQVGGRGLRLVYEVVTAAHGTLYYPIELGLRATI